MSATLTINLDSDVLQSAELAGQGDDTSFKFEQAPEIGLTKQRNAYTVYS